MKGVAVQKEQITVALLMLEAICPSGNASIQIKLLSDGSLMGRYSPGNTTCASPVRPWLQWDALAFPEKVSWAMLADWLTAQGYHCIF